MAAKITDQGLQRIADTASQTAGYSASRFIRRMAVDDSSTAFVAGATTLGSPANLYSQAFDTAPNRAGLVVTHTATIGTANGNFTIRRVSLHDDTTVSGTSATLVGGIDGLGLTKTVDYSLQLNVRVTYSDNS